MNRPPERIGEDFLRIAVFRDNMNDRHAVGAQRGEQLRRARNHQIAAVGGQRERRHLGIEMATMHVDGDECGARRIDGNHGQSFLPCA
jgi:hypothetical protein